MLWHKQKRARVVRAISWHWVAALLGTISACAGVVCLVYGWAMAIDLSNTAAVQGGATLEHLQHHVCAHTRGGWCHVWLQRKALAAPVARLVLHDIPCPGNCSGIGNCDASSGVCYCPAAWSGLDCSQPVKRPCTPSLGGLRRKQAAPFSHIGPDKLDLNLSNHVFGYGRCAGVCDDEYGRCYCRGPGRYGRIPASEGSPLGTPPVQQGRPSHFPCSHPTTGPNGAKLPWGRGPTWQELYGPGGWCVADAPAYTACGCPYDGKDGRGCNAVTEHTCFNQCAGRGKCVHQGFCKCSDGWFGLDCAYPSSLVVTQTAGQQPAITAPWVEHSAVDAWQCYSSGKRCMEERVRRAWVQARSKVSSSGPASPTPAVGSKGSKPGVGDAADCDATVCRAATTKIASMAAGMTDLKLPVQGRRRPLIYVYNIPDSLVSHVFQYRRAKETCSWRIYKEHNTTQLLQEVYGIEVLFLDILLGSQHRTLNPEEADYFYVPVLASCYMTYVHGEQDWPWFSIDSYSRVKGAVVMYQRALDFVKASYPYWNRSQGADHIWMFTHDEGACWAPAELYEKGIILTSWGRNTPDNYPSHTNYGQDNYTHDVRDDPAIPQGFVALIGRHPCYTPGKDIVLPNWKMPATYGSSPYLGAPGPPRDILAFHKGRVMPEYPQFSLGVRQRLDAVARAGNWSSKYNIRVEADQPGSYTELVARSVFCLVMQGDGWSARFTSAIVHGCIPVILMDVADPPFGAELDWQAISVRIPVADIPQIPQLLKSISPARVVAMQSAIAHMWHRMVWLSHPVLVEHVAQLFAANKAQQTVVRNRNTEQWARPGLQEPSLKWFQNDAFQTVMQVLHHRLASRTHQ